MAKNLVCPSLGLNGDLKKENMHFTGYAIVNFLVSLGSFFGKVTSSAPLTKLALASSDRTLSGSGIRL
jgi:hypothetical protein